MFVPYMHIHIHKQLFTAVINNLAPFIRLDKLAWLTTILEVHQPSLLMYLLDEPKT